MVWFPNPAADGGGKSAGGNQSKQPARRAQSIGEQPITLPTAATQPSTDVTSEPPLEPLAISGAADGAWHADAGRRDCQRVDERSTWTEHRSRRGRRRTATRARDREARGGIGDGVRSVGPGVTTPVVIQQVKPQYTADAMRAKVQGSVWLECVVMPDGTVGDVRVTRSLDAMFGLDQEAIAAARAMAIQTGNGQRQARGGRDHDRTDITLR